MGNVCVRGSVCHTWWLKHQPWWAWAGDEEWPHPRAGDLETVHEFCCALHRFIWWPCTNHLTSFCPQSLQEGWCFPISHKCWTLNSLMLIKCSQAFRGKCCVPTKAECWFMCRSWGQALAPQPWEKTVADEFIFSMSLNLLYALPGHA